MKQRTGSSVSSYSTKENEVAEILVKLRSLILELECGHGILPQSWGRKKKRSAISVNPKAEEASSPATPLSFSPSESDENPTSLFRRNVSLKREIKNVNCYFDKLKDYNLKLKAKKQELTHGPRQGVVVHKQPQQQPQFPGVAHHPPLISNQSACGVATTSSGVPSSSSNDVGPIGIPDLNLPLEESMTMEFCEPLDMSVNVANRNLSRAMAAQARQNRLHIYRFKNSIGISKPRYSCR
ncbi:uncharacterized protein LOC108342162 isoform X2 [Vigna angularis]|uniref:uncharacterized protein LOC108342162 isoform X2 n=1 Tax=Phaseolus angularis TaxID=3914 RepID=UPI000809CC8F|nr:uncharacterized protein LOC108342162 isoform X2 [Vigna angularis]